MWPKGSNALTNRFIPATFSGTHIHVLFGIKGNNMSNLRNIALAGAVAIMPAFASAATVNAESTFKETGVNYLAPVSGVAGDATITTGEAPDVRSFTFDFEVTEASIVSGEGNVRFASGFTGLDIMLNGTALALQSIGDQFYFNFGSMAYAAGDTFDITVMFDSATPTNTIDFGLKVAPSAVPVPASAGLLAGGLLAFGALRRRKNAKKA